MNMWMAYHLALGALALFYVLGRGPRSGVIDFVAVAPNWFGVVVGLVLFSNIAHECAAQQGNLLSEAIKHNGIILLNVNIVSTAFYALRSSK
jgi:hypothetical protein